MYSECCKKIEGILNYANIALGNLNELSSLDYPCECINLYRDLLRQVVISSDKIRNLASEIYGECDAVDRGIALIIIYRAETVKLLTEAVLRQDLCKDDYLTLCESIYTLKEVYIHMCNISGEAALLYSECEGEINCNV